MFPSLAPVLGWNLETPADKAVLITDELQAGVAIILSWSSYTHQCNMPLRIPSPLADSPLFDQTLPPSCPPKLAWIAPCAEGSFLLQHFIGMALKRKRKVCILGLAHSKVHYKFIAKKMGNGSQVRDEENDTDRVIWNVHLFPYILNVGNKVAVRPSLLPLLHTPGRQDCIY